MKGLRRSDGRRRHHGWIHADGSSRASRRIRRNARRALRLQFGPPPTAEAAKMLRDLKRMARYG